ncbi:oxidoreductase [Spirosoma litoris]
MWTIENIPDQTGKTALVTGATSGIGYETALALYTAGAHVILAGRDGIKAEQAAATIQAKGGRGTLEIGVLDLASLRQINQFAESIRKRHDQLQILINNAGVMVPPASKTKDGFELQFGVNFLGHFALTGHLYPVLKQTAGARIVTLSSGAHRFVDTIDFANVRSEKSYDPNREYAVSKLADLQFALELQRRFERVGDTLISVAAHPGVTQTALSRHMPTAEYQAAVTRFGELMPAWQGALPALFAATSPTVNGGDYYGPDGESELHGYPALARISDAGRNIEAAKQLWEFAEQTTGVRFPE